MRLTFRARLLLIVATTALSFAVILVVGVLTSTRRAQSLDELEGRLLPRLTLEPALEAKFTALSRGFQDAVAAQDRELLRSTTETRNEIVQELDAASQLLERAHVVRFKTALDSYYSTAYQLSERLIEGETGETMVADIADMQAKQASARDALQRAVRFEKSELSSRFATVRTAELTTRRFRVGTAIVCLVLVGGLSLWFARGALGALRQLVDGLSRFATGNFDEPIVISSHDELGDVARVANHMAQSLQRHAEERDRGDWLKAGLAGLTEELRGELEPSESARRALGFLVEYTGARAGALYLSDDEGILVRSASYALGGHDPKSETAPRFRPGEGLVGQTSTQTELAVLTDLPPGYFRIRSGLGEAAPRALVLLPLSRATMNVGVLELALLEAPKEGTRELFSSVAEPLAIMLDAARSRAALRTLLLQTTEQAERLAAQEEELRVSNDELTEQQEELRQVNEELEEQKRALSQQNQELEDARGNLQQKAEELSRMSSYKSQFLANMSHELRTPLNSMLLLSQILGDNDAKNLSPKQVEHCRTIHSAGRDLLGLINQVLDLAKIEAGKQEIDLEPVPLEELGERMKRAFTALAQDKGLALKVELAGDAPRELTTDRQRLERILTNLIANAIKFTPAGSVTLRIGRPKGSRAPGLAPESSVALAVSDTGIGIAPEARERVFAPFEQVESRPDRRYGGSGLGLAIARESATLLGGVLELESTPGEGSTFTLVLPVAHSAGARRAAGSQNSNAESAAGAPARPCAPDLPGAGSALLVIEDDPVFAEQLLDIIRARGLEGRWAKTGDEGLRIARDILPRGVILDVALPDIDGWTVMERLLHDEVTRKIPVHFISAIDAPERALALGAVGYLTKPAGRDELIEVVHGLLGGSSRDREVLVVEDDALEAESVVALLSREGMAPRHVTNATQALAALEQNAFHCMVLDLGLPDMDGLALLETLSARRELVLPPVVVHTARALTREETRRVESYAQAVVLKDGQSAQRLLEEVRLFVQHVRDQLPRVGGDGAQQELPGISLSGRRILLADDDMRTVYALSALLRGKGADVLVAETGREALELLEKHVDIDGVLMDVMMPEMDGYEAIRRLRQNPRFGKLPVIALTAKAMKGERERCLQAGASEYLSKPVDPAALLVMLSARMGNGSSARP